MSTTERDPIFDSLDRLARIADTDPSDDRMPDIERRVRATRRNRGLVAIAVGAVLAIVGIGVGQGLPDQHASGPVAPPGKPWQRISIDARPSGAVLRISYSITGKATGDAAPRSTTVKVDGKVVEHSGPTGDSAAASCSADGALSPYTQRFHLARPLEVPVPPGRHTVVVEAPYCAGADLVPSSERTEVRTGLAGFTTFDSLDADLDGDGTADRLRILVPDDPIADHQLLNVTWGSGEITMTNLPNTMETSLLAPADLDGDGDLEVIVQGGGGEISVATVFQADPAALDEVTSVDARGDPVALTSEADPSAWQTAFGPDGVSSYRLTDLNDTQPPAPVEIRSWSLDGTTLTQSTDSIPGCVTFSPTFVLGPC